jgi:hypothetical protein
MLAWPNTVELVVDAGGFDPDVKVQVCVISPVAADPAWLDKIAESANAKHAAGLNEPRSRKRFLAVCSINHPS